MSGSGIYLIVGTALFALGFFVGAQIRPPRPKAIIGLALGVLPLAGVAVLYLSASRTGCSGGDCTGPMIGMLALGLLAAPVSVFGFGILAQAGLAWMVRETGGA